MSSVVKCPGCKQRINIATELMGQVVQCPMCKMKLNTGQSSNPVSSSPPVQSQPPRQVVAAPPYYRPDNQRHDSRRPAAEPQLYTDNQKKSSNPLPWILGLLGGGCFLVFLLAVVGVFLIGRAARNQIVAELEAQDRFSTFETLLEAREGFTTKLAQQQSDNAPVPQPPREQFDLVKYQSPIGQMSAYVSKPDDPAVRQPAIIWKFGGFGNGIGETAWQPQPKSNDQSASAFRKNGVVMMYPALRGGNDNPGHNECFFGEVDDILAAADYLSKQPFVDPDRIYLGGHSTGGTLVLLCAASSNRFRAVFAFGPVDDISGYGQEILPFDINDSNELALRNPENWLHAIKCPTFAFEGSGGNAGSLLNLVRQNDNPFFHGHVVPGFDHFNVLGPVNELVAKKVSEDSGQVCNIEITAEELGSLR